MAHIPPLRPELAEYLAGPGRPLTLTVGPDDIPAARESGRRKAESELGKAARRDDIRVETWPASADGQVPLLIARPRHEAVGRPLVMHVHGGGTFSGTSASGLRWLVEWALDLDAVVVSPDYRLAPEHPFPAALEDCDRAFDRVLAEARTLGVDRTRTVLAGTSAGGGIAAGLTLRRRDRRQTLPGGLMLLAPMLDDRTGSIPGTQPNDSPVWDEGANATGWSAYLGRASVGAEQAPYAAPGRASDLSCFPPTYLDVGTTELFRTETVEFAERLWRAGTAAELHVWSGAFHGFDQLAPWSGLARQALQARLGWLRQNVAAPA